MKVDRTKLRIVLFKEAILAGGCSMDAIVLYESLVLGFVGSNGFQYGLFGCAKVERGAEIGEVGLLTMKDNDDPAWESEVRDSWNF